MKKWVPFLPAVLFYALIFLISSQDFGDSIDIDHLDKAAHVLEFGLLGFFLAVGFFNTLSLSTATKSRLTFGSGLILAILDEFHQFFVPPRKSDIADVLPDAVGLVIGIAVFRYLAGRRKPPPKNPN